jgi:serine protease AprX
VVRQHLVRQQLVRQHLVGQHLEREHLVGQHLVGQHLVGQQLVGQHLVGEHLVGRELELMNTVQRTRLTGIGVTAALLATTFVPSTTLAASYSPAKDPYSMAALTAMTGATAWWNAGYTGKGVDVALIDTGVAPVAGLSGAGKVVYGPDLSLESQNPTFRYIDTNGHGTFMAGLIAGRDSTLTAPYASAPASAYRGVAPDARILSVKVGTADGGVDVSQMIAAIDWVVQHKADNGMNVRVINLSYGTNSLQASGVDPLSFAVEQAWRAGIVVVAAAGNTGFQFGAGAPGLADPAYNPYVIAVGGYDAMGTADTSDDVIGAYSASTNCLTCKLPDVLAIGSHLQGLRVPGSYIDLNHPEGLLGDRYFRGTGTSEAAALISGAVALLLQKFPALSPDQVKAWITRSSSLLVARTITGQGFFEIDLGRLVTTTPPDSFYTQAWPAATGTGTLEAARGTDRLTDNGVVLGGEQDIFGMPFGSAAMAKLEAAGRSWSGGTWNGSAWTGSTWADAGWAGRSWSTASWTGRSWSGDAWAGRSWSANTWDGRSWSGRSWSGRSWSGAAWSGRSWSDGGWN